MGLGLVSLLAALQSTSPNTRNTSVPYDSSKAAAEEVASYLRDNGEREIFKDSADYYVQCWSRSKEARKDNEIVTYRLCRASFRDPESSKLINRWYLRFIAEKPDNMTIAVTDYGVSGHPQFCGFIVAGEFETLITDPKECDSIYNSLISFLRTPLKEEREYRNF